MPTYDFKCSKCNHNFDTFRKIANRDAPLSEPCPSCGEVGSIESIIGAPAMSYSGDRASLGSKLSPLRDRLQEIHERTPGSRLDQCSTITKI